MGEEVEFVMPSGFVGLHFAAAIIGLVIRCVVSCVRIVETSIEQAALQLEADVAVAVVMVGQRAEDDEATDGHHH